MAARVLIVDDAAFMRHLIKDIITSMGHEVVGEAGDGFEACTKYAELHPDMVTLDLVMPNKGGLDTLKDIRGEDPHAKVLIVSALDQRQPLMEALRLGAVDYIVKPFDKDRVEQAIKRALPA
jgi:two-component system chemotaxis response regulator CheY